MRQSISFGRIAGIPIGASWTWLPVVVLLVWLAAVDFFPRQNPGLSNGAYIGMAVAEAVLLFSGLLAHELGHGLQARRDGMRVEGITLWLFGGVARFSGEFPGAGAELRVAAAGPAATLVIGTVSLTAALLLPLPAVADGVLFWLGVLSMLLLIGNLIPAYPLDGGRILHALLWRVRNDRRKATEISAAVGRICGYMLIGGGIFLALTWPGRAVVGLWLMTMGWFVMAAATGESRSEAVRGALAGLTVADVIERDPICVLPTLTLTEFFAEVVWSQRHTTYPVFDGERVVGLLPFGRVASVPRVQWDDTRIEQAMVPLADVVLLEETAPLSEAISRLATSDLQRGLVIEDDQLVGLVSVSDIARAFERRARLL
jgi:Zn-dependent protease/CBS domain-containing protein